MIDNACVVEGNRIDAINKYKKHFNASPDVVFKTTKQQLINELQFWNKQNKVYANEDLEKMVLN